MNTRTLVPAAAAVLLLAGCADDDGVGALQPDAISSSPVVPVQASAELTDPEGSRLGTARFTDQADGVQVEVEVHGMSTGAHPVHLYGVGRCRPPAGSGQIGELPAVQVTGTGVGALSTVVGSVDLADLLTGDGTALVVDEAADAQTGSSAGPTSGDPAAGTQAPGAPGSGTACGVLAR
jgi:Cu-Zn family superoxide dismutase